MRKHCLLLAQLGRNNFMSISSLKISASLVSMFIAMNNMSKENPQRVSNKIAVASGKVYYMLK